MPVSGIQSSIYLKNEWKNDIADLNYKIFKEYLTYSNAWRSNALLMENARFNRIISPQEEKDLIKFRQAPIPVPILSAIEETAEAMISSNRPTVYVAPLRRPRDETYNNDSLEISKLFKFNIQKSWFDSYGGLQYQKIVRDQGTVGHGLFYIMPRNEFGEFSVETKHLSWKYFLGDPDSISPFYDDMDNQIYAMPISHDKAFKYVKHIEPDLTRQKFEDFIKGSVAETFGRVENDPIYESLNTKKQTFFICRNSLEEQNVFLKIPKDYKQEGVEYRTADEITDELRRREKQGEIELKPIRKFFLTQYISVGNYGFKKVFPVTKYNIVGAPHDHRENPYPYSRVWYIYPLQRAINKFLTSTVLNAALINTTKVLAEEGSIVNKKKWEMSASISNSILEYKLQIPGQSQPPEIIPPVPLTDAYLAMPRYLTQIAEYATGIFATMQGNPEGSPDVFSTVASLQSAAGQRIKNRQFANDAVLSRVGEVMGEFYKHYSPINGFAASFNPKTQSEDFIDYNVLNIEYGQDTDGKRTAKSSIKSGTDLSKGYRHVRFTSQSSNGYEAATEASMLTLLSTQNNLPQLVPLILEKMNISGTEDVIKSIKNSTDLVQQNKSLQDMVQKIEGQNEKLKGSIFTLIRNLEAAKAKGHLDVEIALFKKDPQAYMEKAVNNQGDR